MNIHASDNTCILVFNCLQLTQSKPFLLQIVQVFLITVSYLVEEAIAVDRELVDNFLDDWLGLQECEDSASDVLIDDFTRDFDELLDRDSPVLVIEVRRQRTYVLLRDLLDQIAHDVGKFVASQIASSVHI